MQTELGAIVDSNRGRLAMLYEKSFDFFEETFRPKTDVSGVQLQSFLPASVYTNREVLGTIITAALMAMLDHRCDVGGRLNAPDELLAIMKMIAPPPVQDAFDEIVIRQAGILGAGLFASDLALMRFVHWQQTDYEKVEACLEAMDTAAKTQQGISKKRPITDPFTKDAKAVVVKELRPILETLYEKFRTMHRTPTDRQIVEAFESEVRLSGDISLRESHTLNRWLEFIKSDPLQLLKKPEPARLFDHFMGFLHGLKGDYARQEISELR
jgi:hypothetical protein